MPGKKLYTAEYFHLFAKARESPSSLVNNLNMLADSSIRAINCREFPRAKRTLLALKQCFEHVSPLLDMSATEKQHRDLMQIMVLRKRVLELRLENAVLRGDHEQVEEIQNALASMDEFFAAAIADLDPFSEVKAGT